MRIDKSARRFAKLSTIYRDLEFFVAICLFVLSWFVMSVVVFLRKDFGKNYVNWINLFFGYSAIGFFIEIGMFGPRMGH